MRSYSFGKCSSTGAAWRGRGLALLCVLLLGVSAACSSDSDGEGGGGKAAGGSGGSGGAGGDGGSGGEEGVAFIRLREGEAAVAEHHTVAFAAEAVDIRGERLAGAVFTWRSSDEAIATVDEEGVATGHRPGWVRIVASLGDVEAAALLQVRGGEVATVEVTPARRNIGLGESLQLEAVALDSKERQLHVDAVEWASKDPSIASVSPEGLVRAHRLGTTSITASIAGTKGSARLEVSLRFVDVSLGEDHACARAADGSAFCWGRNSKGELGTGSLHPYSPYLLAVWGPSFSRIATGNGTACGLGWEGEVSCWGNNGRFALGREDIPWSPVPVPTPWGALRLSSIGSRGNHFCGLDEAGHAWCWGLNSADGVLGHESVDDSAIPLPVSAPVAGGEALVFEELKFGWGQTCGKTESKRLFCWGENLYGELGDGTDASSWRPVETMLGREVQAFDAGGDHACALSVEGKLYCWGDNGSGQAGQENTTIDYFEPTEVDTQGKTFVSLALGGEHSCALDERGRAWCWGYNGSGELGNGTTDDSVTPTEVAGEHRFVFLAGGSDSTCGLVEAGDIYCWGYNGSHGQLGNGAGGGYSAVPVKVVQAPPED